MSEKSYDINRGNGMSNPGQFGHAIAAPNVDLHATLGQRKVAIDLPAEQVDHITAYLGEWVDEFDVEAIRLEYDAELRTASPAGVEWGIGPGGPWAMASEGADPDEVAEALRDACDAVDLDAIAQRHLKTEAKVVQALNSYSGDNEWQDVIMASEGYDDEATHALFGDQAEAAVVNGRIIRHRNRTVTRTSDAPGGWGIDPDPEAELRWEWGFDGVDRCALVVFDAESDEWVEVASESIPSAGDREPYARVEDLLTEEHPFRNLTVVTPG